MTVHRRNKGARGEREAAKWLAQWTDPEGNPIEARRGCQFAGGDDSPDVKHSLKGYHIEVKRDEAFSVSSVLLRKALYQADGDAEYNAVPLVMWRRNRERWRITFAVEQFIDSAWHRDRPGMEAEPVTMDAAGFMMMIGCKRI